MAETCQDDRAMALQQNGAHISILYIHDVMLALLPVASCSSEILIPALSHARQSFLIFLIHKSFTQTDQIMVKTNRILSPSYCPYTGKTPKKLAVILQMGISLCTYLNPSLCIWPKLLFIGLGLDSRPREVKGSLSADFPGSCAVLRVMHALLRIQMQICTGKRCLYTGVHVECVRTVHNPAPIEVTSPWGR